MKAVALALLLAQIVPLRAAHIFPESGGEEVVDGGAWLSDAELIRLAKVPADLRERNAYLETHTADVPMLWIVVAVVAGLSVGAIAGYGVAKVAK